MFIYIFFVKTNFVSKQFQELANGISKILLCLQTVECLLWFPKFIWVVQSGTGLYGVVRDSTGRHDVVRCGTGWHSLVRGAMVWYGVVRRGTPRIGFRVYAIS